MFTIGTRAKQLGVAAQNCAHARQLAAVTNDDEVVVDACLGILNEPDQ